MRAVFNGRVNGLLLCTELHTSKRAWLLWIKSLSSTFSQVCLTIYLHTAPGIDGMSQQQSEITPPDSNAVSSTAGCRSTDSTLLPLFKVVPC